MTELRVEPCTRPADWRTASRLLAEYLEWLGPRCGVEDIRTLQPSAAAETDDLAGAYGGVGDRFFVARTPRQAIGVVGARWRDPDEVEMTRLYVRPAGRGLSAGRHLVASVIGHARALGAGRVVLETAPALMPAAYAIYESFGFARAADAEPAAATVEGAVRLVRELGPPDRSAAEPRGGRRARYRNQPAESAMRCAPVEV